MLHADSLRPVGLAFGLVRRGNGGQKRQLIPPASWPRSEDRAGCLGAQALVAGVGEQGDAWGEGQQLDQAGLADLGQIVDGARDGSVHRTAAARRLGLPPACGGR